MPLARTASRAIATPGTHLGTVTRIDGAEAYVLLEVAPGFEYGPARYPDTLGDLAAGEEVAVAFLDGRLDDVVVLARLA